MKKIAFEFSFKLFLAMLQMWWAENGCFASTLIRNTIVMDTPEIVGITGFMELSVGFDSNKFDLIRCPGSQEGSCRLNEVSVRMRRPFKWLVPVVLEVVYVPHNSRVIAVYP